MSVSIRFKYDLLYKKHVNAVKQQGKSVEVFACAVQRIIDFFDRSPGKPKIEFRTRTARF